MKAKTLMGMIACASACVSLSAFGNNTNDWFSVGVTGDAIVPVNCATNGAAVSVENNKIVLDNDSSTKFAITPAVALASTNSTDIAKIDVTALLTPSSTNDLVAIDGAKAGFAVGIDDQDQTNYYGYASGEWHKLTGGDPEKDGDTTFSIIINYRDSVVDFVADGVDLTPTPLSIAANSSFTGIDAFGSGSITSVDSKFEVAEVAVGSQKYGSVAEAIAHQGTTATILNVSATGEISSGTSTTAGLPVAVCKALGLDADSETPAQVKVVPIAADAETSYITLAMDPNQYVEPGVAVKFAIKKNGSPIGELVDATAIKIPISEGTGVYTIEPAGVAAAK